MTGGHWNQFPLGVQLPTPATPPIIQVPVSSHMVVHATPSWIPEKTKYPMSLFAYAPLINGQRTFAAVAEAIRKAKKSIDIITWGFQPSMYFERDTFANAGKFPNIGELLVQKRAKVYRFVYLSGLTILGKSLKKLSRLGKTDCLTFPAQ